MNVAAKADDIVKAKAVQEFEQFDVAKTAIGQDRRRHALRQKRLQPGQAQILKIVALVLQLILVDGQPKKRRGSPVACDEMQRERGLIVGIEIGPVHRHDDIAPGSHDLGNPRPEQVPRKHARSNRSTCLIADLVINPRAVAKACPIRETASAAPVITPSVPLVKERMRLACKSSPNARLKKS